MPSDAASALTPAQANLTVTMPAQWSEPGLLFRNYAGANGPKSLAYNSGMGKFLYDWPTSTYEFSDDGGGSWWPSISTFGGGILVWWSAAGVLSLSWSCYTIEWGRRSSTAPPALPCLSSAGST